MCMECRTHPCHPACPNSDPPTPIAYCCECGEEIYSWGEYAKVGFQHWCPNCIQKLPYGRLMPLLDAEWKTVQPGEAIVCADCGEVIGKEYPLENSYAVISDRVVCEYCLEDLLTSEIVTQTGHSWNSGV